MSVLAAAKLGRLIREPEFNIVSVEAVSKVWIVAGVRHGSFVAACTIPYHARLTQLAYAFCVGMQEPVLVGAVDRIAHQGTQGGRRQALKDPGGRGESVEVL